MEKLLTPQQELFLSLYTDPRSDTFSNALRSALKAGYAQEYAENITSQMPEWLSENLGDMKRLRKAERVLDKTLDYEPVNEEGKLDNSLLKTQTEVAKFVAERLNKGKYSTRNELTGKGGENLKIEISKEIAEKYNLNDSPQSTEDNSNRQAQI